MAIPDDDMPSADLALVIANTTDGELSNIFSFFVRVLTIRGVSAAEIRFMLETALAKASQYELRH